MDNLVTHIFTTSNHPIKRVAREKQEVYLAGMGALLYDVSNGDANVELLYNALCYSIIGEYCSTKWFNTEGLNDISKAIKTERKWWNPWSIKKTFFFDCFYILETIDDELRNKADQRLKDYCSTLSEKHLKESFYAFYGHSLDNIRHLDAELIEQYNNNKMLNDRRSFKILVVANVSAGKSTLINALTGWNVAKSSNLPCTSRLEYIYNKPYIDLIIYKKDMYMLSESIESIIDDDIKEIGFPFKSSLASECICFIDSPGVNNSNSVKHKEITQNAIVTLDYDMILYVFNGKHLGTTDERLLLDFIHKHSDRPIVFALNQMDCYDKRNESIKEAISNVIKDLEKAGFVQPKVLPVSAKAALLMKLENLDDEDNFEKEHIIKKISNEYYDLPRYVGAKTDIDILSKSGITLLEQSIIKIKNYEDSKH